MWQTLEQPTKRRHGTHLSSLLVVVVVVVAAVAVGQVEGGRMLP